MRVGQPGEQPALPRELGPGHRVIGPPITIGIQVNGIAIGKGKSADPEDSHRTTVTTPAAPGEAPASDTGRLANSIVSELMQSAMTVIITAGKGIVHAEMFPLLDRAKPNPLELSLFSVVWSEHYSYKSSRRHLAALPTTGERVLVGPGENAGVLDAGDGIAVAIRIESHNHPSAIEPHQGAATGVGGILRDIFTMGARPLCVMDPLFFGELDEPRQRWLFDGVVAGISSYGNSVGVPTVGGELTFDPTYAENPLVNVLCMGAMPVGRLVLGRASGVGNVALLLGSTTGRDGIGGVSGTGLSATQASFQDGTGSIDVGFTAAPRQLSAVTQTGAVSIRVPSGMAYQVKAGSKAGSVHVSVPQSPAASRVITATTTIGAVSVRNG